MKILGFTNLPKEQEYITICPDCGAVLIISKNEPGVKFDFVTEPDVPCCDYVNYRCINCLKEDQNSPYEEYNWFNKLLYRYIRSKDYTLLSK